MRSRLGYHDDSELQGIPSVFEFNPVPDRVELPIDFTAEIKMLPKRFVASNDWILDAYEHCADTYDASGLEVERLAYFGKRACDEASSIRYQIAAGVGQTEAIVENFNSVIGSRRKQFKAHPGSGMIPELKKMFMLEERAERRT
jgi:hypothetical protein